MPETDFAADWYLMPAHTFDDDGYPAKCFGGDVEITDGDIDKCTGIATCRKCGQTMKAICMG